MRVVLQEKCEATEIVSLLESNDALVTVVEGSRQLVVGDETGPGQPCQRAYLDDNSLGAQKTVCLVHVSDRALAMRLVDRFGWNFDRVMEDMGYFTVRAGKDSAAVVQRLTQLKLDERLALQ